MSLQPDALAHEVLPPIPRTPRRSVEAGRAAVVASVLLLAGSLASSPGALAAGSSDADDAAASTTDTAPSDAGPVDTEALARLGAFTTDLESFRADFEQTLYGADSEPLQSSTGSVVLKRPGRFVWEYAGEDSQKIVADGERIWLYDRELAQVTVNDIDERLAGTPFVLLMSSAPLAEAYDVTSLGDSEGVEWFELVPKVDGGDFEALFVGLDEAGLAALELRDNFGQATQILFTNFEADVALDDARFVFEVPEGVDVIGLER